MLTEIDTISDKAITKLDAILARVDLSVPDLLCEEIDADLADIAGLKPEVIDDLEVILAKTAIPARPTASVPPPTATGTVKISVRVPARTLAALKARAAEFRQPYQKVLNQALNDAVKGWEAPAAKTGYV